jgi:hypothetical protein
MVLRFSRNRLYQIVAFIAVSLAIYNWITWSSAPEEFRWRQDYVRAFIGGISLSFASICFTILSFLQQDKIIILCERHS